MTEYSRFHHNPTFGPYRSTLFPFKDQPPDSVFSHRESFANEEMSKRLLTFQTDPPASRGQIQNL